MIAGMEKRLFTASELEQMARAGILSEDDRVELIYGEIVKMSPIGKVHAACVDRLTRFFNKAADDSVMVRGQGPILIGEYIELQPDLALMKARPDFYEASLPTGDDILLVIVVADATVSADRRIKMPLYAAAGIPIAWVVNLPKSVVEVYSDPRDGVYQRVERLTRKGVIALDIPGIAESGVRVDSFL
ncbi:MAG: Uma2 family endonuclease [Chloroflexia bacterium]